MNIAHLKSDGSTEWNALAMKEPMFSLLQSWEWGDFKERLGWKAFRVGLADGDRLVAGAQLLIKPLAGGLLSVAYLPKGPIGRWREESSTSLLFREIHGIARAHRSAFLKVDPPVFQNPAFDEFMRKAGFRISRFPIQPRATILLDLTPDLGTIMKGFTQKTRQYIRGAMRDGIKVQYGGENDIEHLSEFSRLVGQRKGIPYRKKNFFLQEWQTFGTKNMMALLLAKRQGRTQAVRAILRFGSHAAEFHGASDPAASRSRANYLLVWEGIQWAKSQGCKTYDLWGVPDEVGQLSYENRIVDVAGRKSGLWGVYQFKRGFSREVLYYAASFDFFYFYPLYLLLSRWGGESEILERLSSWSDCLR
jgi:peptidoglycan pentaglycine glycine transferase (the first glycine)